MENIEDITPLENAPDRGAYTNQRNYEKDITSWLLKFVVFGNGLSSVAGNVSAKHKEVVETATTVEDVKTTILSAKDETVSAKDIVVQKAQEVATNTQAVEDAKDTVLEAQTNIVANAEALSNNLINDTQATDKTLYSSEKINDLLYTLATDILDAYALKNGDETQNFKAKKLIVKDILTDNIENNGWFRAKGQVGFYFQDYGGGWHMTDSPWIRAYNAKKIYTGNSEQNAFLAEGGITANRGFWHGAQHLDDRYSKKRATSTEEGGVKVRLSGTTLYMTSDGSNP